jgi:hypothetical protein
MNSTQSRGRNETRLNEVDKAFSTNTSELMMFLSPLLGASGIPQLVSKEV